MVLALLLTITTASYALKFVVNSDTQSDRNAHQSVVNAYAPTNPELVLNTGDLYQGYGGDEAATFRTILNSKPNIGALLSANKYLAAMGNHENVDNGRLVTSFTPPIVRNGSIYYSSTEGNCFFVCMAMNPSLNNDWMEQELSSGEAQAAQWRFVFCHAPIYSIGQHYADGITTEKCGNVGVCKGNVELFRALCDQHKVAMVFSGHDHLYQRSNLIFEGAVVSDADSIGYEEKGTIYTVGGAAGGTLTTPKTGPQWFTNTSIPLVRTFLEITADADRLEMLAKNTSGQTIDHIVLIHDPQPVSVQPPLSPAASNSSTRAVVRVYNTRGRLVGQSRSSRVDRSAACGLAAGMYVVKGHSNAAALEPIGGRR